MACVTDPGNFYLQSQYLTMMSLFVEKYVFRLPRLTDDTIWPHIALQTGSTLGKLVSKYKQLTGSVTNGI